MVWPSDLLETGDSLLQQRLGLSKFLPLPVVYAEVNHCFERVGVIGPSRHSEPLHGAIHEGLDLVESILIVIAAPKVCHGFERAQMHFTPGLAEPFQPLEEQG